MSVYGIMRTIVFTVITFIATVLLVVETPATGGYFNLGEVAIYVISFMASPITVAVAAGLGPALADLLLGYWYFAPATLAIKFCEGYLVSALIHKLRQEPEKSRIVKLLTVVMGVALSLIVLLNTVGEGEESLGISLTWTQTSLMGITISVPSIAAYLPSYTWIIISVLIVLLSIVVALIEKPYMLAMSLGGLVMVTGYFVYEFFVSNPVILGRDPIGAVFEVPVNVGQFVVGVLLAIPVVQFIERATKG
uniref:ECF transporter S component n=1 Tax=Ignisphaera aggregans TaxID=334771 RepID=A0A7C2V8X5_9CREN